MLYLLPETLYPFSSVTQSCPTHCNPMDTTKQQTDNKGNTTYFSQIRYRNLKEDM